MYLGCGQRNSVPEPQGVKKMSDFFEKYKKNVADDDIDTTASEGESQARVGTRSHKGKEKDNCGKVRSKDGIMTCADTQNNV